MTGGAKRQRAHTHTGREKPVGFTAGHAAAAAPAARTEKLLTLHRWVVTFRRWKIWFDQSNALCRIDCVHQIFRNQSINFTI